MSDLVDDFEILALESPLTQYHQFEIIDTAELNSNYNESCSSRPQGKETPSVAKTQREQTIVATCGNRKHVPQTVSLTPVQPITLTQASLNKVKFSIDSRTDTKDAQKNITEKTTTDLVPNSMKHDIIKKPVDENRNLPNIPQSSTLIKSNISDVEQVKSPLLSLNIGSTEKLPLASLPRRVGAAAHIPYSMTDDLDISSIINQSKHQTMNLLTMPSNNLIGDINNSNDVMKLIKEEQKTRKSSYVNYEQNDDIKQLLNQKTQTNLLQHAENERKAFLNTVNATNYW